MKERLKLLIVTFIDGDNYSQEVLFGKQLFFNKIKDFCYQTACTIPDLDALYEKVSWVEITRIRLESIDGDVNPPFIYVSEVEEDSSSHKDTFKYAKYKEEKKIDLLINLLDEGLFEDALIYINEIDSRMFIKENYFKLSRYSLPHTLRQEIDLYNDLAENKL